MITLLSQENDDLIFIRNIETIIHSQVGEWKLDDVYLIRIDNWFDDKWLGFSGTLMHEIAIHELQDVIIPPFHPNRVVNSVYYQLEDGNYVQKDLTKPLHLLQTSTDNLQRKITHFTDNGLIIWYSSNSKTNSVGTVMIYPVKNGECYPFHITLMGDKKWKVQKTKGIARKQVQEILDTT